MSGSGRKRVSKWDAKQENIQNGNDYVEKSGSYHRDKDPEHAGFYPEGNGRNGSRRSVPDDDDDGERLKSRQHPGEAWPSRGRVSHEEGDDAMMSYYDTRKSSEQDESRQPYWDRPRTRRSVGSRSNSRSMSRSRSRSRSPLQRVRRDARGSYDRHKTRDNDGRYSRAGDYDWEAKNRDTKYYNEDSREQYPLRRSDYPEDHSNSRRETSDPILRSHRDRRDVPEREHNRVSNVPCRYFPLGNCRNGTSCRFSHHGARRSLERKPQDQMFSRHDSGGTTERMRNSHRWNERSDTGKSNEGSKGDNNNNNGSWIGDMEMSPDWNYGVKTLKNPLKEEHGVVKDILAPAYEHGSAAISHSHHGFSNNNIANTAPPVQVFNQNIENHSAVPYQCTPLAVGGSQVLPPPPPAVTTTHLPENGIAQNTVSREELNHISNISASLAQFFGNGQPIPQLQSTLNPKQAMQVPEVYGKEEQSSHAQSDLLNSIQTGVVPAVQILNSDTLISLAGNPKASSDEDRDKKIDEEASKEPDVRKTEQEGGEETGKDAEEEEEEDENSKKEKDPKGMKAFKFALVEIVKELLKPAWKEGGMNKDAYKNIVKKAVDKVTGAIQTGNIPQTQEKIDHYLSASKPKLTKLVQAYISKVKKS
uniref:C3H1-type domain-containing protein n=1 Tax=Brassica oleracea TaxID=3712 RepID=A0A3P6G4U8_BRAOL|nr:unnamed protein product [Brassica oleracea]